MQCRQTRIPNRILEDYCCIADTLGACGAHLAEHYLITVGEGLFIGMLNGLIFLNFIYFFNVGLLITMVYVCMAHIMVILMAVAYNVIVNIFFGKSFFLHLAPRLVAGVVGIFWFLFCWANHSIIVPWL